MKRTAIIIGAGPAGLTAAYELLKRTDITPIILEKSGDIGGISKTVNYKGNRIDIGGHRFFSKSDRVMNWWLSIMPVQAEGQSTFNISYQNKSREVDTASIGATDNAGKDPDKVMLVRKRLSRIYFLRKFFTYPIQLSVDTLRKLGLWTTIAIMFSYLKAQLLPRRPEATLEDFMINRFGRTLYELFFRDYTQKVWGVPCHKISADWGAQRIKGVSIAKAIRHAVQSAVQRKRPATDLAQKDTETSLIEQFLYPKFGPGQLWEEVARQVESMGGRILMHHDAKRIYTSENGTKITAVAAINNVTGETSYLEGDYFFSTMPVQELIGGMDGPIPDDVKYVASGLLYRDFITVGVLLKKLSFQDKKTGEWKPLELKDTWIYIQEKDVTVGRLQIFNNWSPHMVKDPDTTWVGMEFFCNTTDDFWKKTDEEIKKMAIGELEKIGLASEANVLDATVLRVEKTYPAYFGTYERFDVVREYVDRIENLFLVGRNGMHKYNNSDHSMLTAMVAVDNIAAGVVSKANIWAINTEQEYHEEKTVVAGNGRLDDLEPVDIAKMKSLTDISFKEYVLGNKWNKGYLLCAVAAVVFQWIVFKFLYPYASFISGDSYSYLETAARNLPINTYPIGYSRFLRIFSSFTTSDTVLVSFQYLLLQGCNLFFLFTLWYFYRPGNIVRNVLYAFVVINPVFLYMANYISSDAIFLSLSILWFTLLLWIIHRPTAGTVVVQCFVLFIAFTVRYNALFYPIVAGLALILSQQRLLLKLAGIVGSIVLIAAFIWHTSNQYERYTGKRQFSPFSGWQLANNALYAYKFVDSNDIKPVPLEFKDIDKMVRTFFDTTRDFTKHPEEALVASTVYMWDTLSPLRLYMKIETAKDSAAGPITRWATVAPKLADYGIYLIRQYPIEYFKYYLLPNIVKYCMPPVEFLSAYNMGKDSVAPIAQTWFGYKTLEVKSRFKTKEVSILNWFPNLVLMINIGFLLVCVGFLVFKGWKIANKRLIRTIIFIAGLWIINFCFSVFASPIALRFQMFPIIVLFMFTSILSEFIYKLDSYEKQEPIKNKAMLAVS